MILFKRLPTKHAYLSIIAVSLLSLIAFAGLFFVVNIQYQKPKGVLSSGPITTPPKSLRLDLDQPEQDALSFSSSIIVSGKTGPNKDVLISTETNDFVIQSKTDGSFSTVLNLQEGTNSITVVVFDSTGDSRIAKRIVYYVKEKI